MTDLTTPPTPEQTPDRSLDPSGAPSAEAPASRRPRARDRDRGRLRGPARAPAEKGLLHYLGVTVSAAFLLLVVALAVLTIALPALVGGRPLTVLTQSMEPGLPPGTLIVVHPVPVGEIRVGDVLTYQIESGKPGVVSHRVIEKTISTDGSTTFVTKGDNNDLPDENPVQEVQIVGVLWYSIPLLGWVNNAVNGEWRGVIVPVVVGGLFVYAAWMFISGIRDHRRRRRP